MNQTNMPPAPVSQEKAMEHGLFTIRSFWAHAARGLDEWDNVQLEEKPLSIYDLNGQILFYEFQIMNRGKPLGLIKASASKTVGSAVPLVQVTPRNWDPVLAMKRAKEEAKKSLPKAKIEDAKFVCYSYPRIGVSINFSDPGLGEGILIFDASSFNLVDGFGDDERDGFVAWSFYNDIAFPEADKREMRWNILDREMEALKETSGRLMAEKSSMDDRASIQQDLTKSYREMVVNQGGITQPGIVIKLYSERIIQYGPHCTTHDCYRLLGQERDDYCAVATGQMILDFYRYYYTQDQIATAMSYVAGSGCGQSGQIAGYMSRSNNSLIASVDYSPTWAKARGEIDENRPLKSGIPGHARACFGYRAANLWIKPPRPLWLFILDPWPWNANSCQGGAVSWEDWYPINHTNYIYVRHRTQPCP